ncbi:hypothetical protein Nepgr_012911 [Nepenthes gracilis]|uniref:Phytocyanin domain-containing protein n=1 Tax=Nepenthes gracilis TaxID=150966 RepID=A0AAD3XNT8_NEPGR|nr:hypothetical protein Nepgr_012911 [Nepenthes gracilis]
MESEHFLRCVVVLLMVFLGSSEGRRFYVGSRDGWVVSPYESYNHWAERNRFQVNDTLFFKYKKERDSVLVVTMENYYKCNATRPLKSLTEGDSELKLDRSGPFFFISGNADHCGRGQKLIVTVLAVRHRAPPAAPSPSPSLSPSPPAQTPGAASPTVVQPPANAPSGVEAPSPAPAPAASHAASFGGSVGLVLGLAGGVTLVLAGIVGLV